MATSMTVLLLWCLLQGVAGKIWTVSMPDSVMGLEGSCVRIPCSFTIDEAFFYYLDSSCKAQWSTGFEKPIVFDSSRTGDLNLLQGALVGDLTEKDCTTIFHNITISKSKYFFRLQCNNFLSYSYLSGVAVTIKDEWKPYLRPGGTVDVQEGRPVMLSCTAQIACPLQPPTLSWRPSLGDTQEKVGATSVTSVLTFNASSVHHGEKIFCSSLYKRQGGHRNVSFEKRLTLNVLSPPRILPSSGCSRPAPLFLGGPAWVRCSCGSIGRLSMALEWWLDGKLVLGSENVSISQEDLDNTTLRSSLTMRAPAGTVALSCHSSNAVGKISQKILVPFMDTQLYLTDSVVFIVKSAVIFVGLVCAMVCIIRSHKMGKVRRSFNNATVKRTPPEEAETEVIISSDQDIFVNSGMQMNTVGPRE